MMRQLKLGIVLVLALGGSSAMAATVYNAIGSTATATFQSQSAATAGNLTIGLVDSFGQEAILFDNTSPPSNPNGIGPVGPGAIATLTFTAPAVTVDVTNMDTSGFALGFGDSSTDYTDFTKNFGFFIQDGVNIYFSDIALNSDHLKHLLLTPQGSNLLLSYSSSGSAPYNDAGVLIGGVTAVPIPATVWTGLSLLVGMGCIATLRHRKTQYN